ncbi:MAG: diacylglycerol kinase family lipid kinase [Sandaracinaceae bacterium]|nr:diacylglycerol kinase family lipid kinase [Sandaracinaceae bacterium]
MTALTLVANPRAGAGRGAKVLPRVERALRDLGADVRVALTERPEDATRLVREALEAGATGIAVIGGDGTLSEATHGFFRGGVAIRPEAWLAPISSGTGGDFRKSLGAGNVGSDGATVEDVVGRMWRAPVRAIDVGHLRYVANDGREAERTFLNITSFGIGGLVDRLVNEAPKWMGGGPAFFAGTVRALARYTPQRVRVTVDGGAPREAVITNVAVCNGRFFGGGMHVAPEASLDDGLFDVVTMHALGLRAAARLTPRLYRGTHLGQPGVDHERGRVVIAEPVDPREHVLLDVDGEAPGRLPARFEIKPRALLLRG